MQRSRSRKLARRAQRSKARSSGASFQKLVRHASIGAAVMAAMPAARAQPATFGANIPSTPLAPLQQPDATATTAAGPPAPTAVADQSGLQEVVVTATRRAEDIQNIPLTISALGQATLENQNIQNFQDYALALPQVSFTSDNPGGFAQVFMRGIGATGAFATSGANQTVGIYLDEQPITTAQGALDLHTYDINRVEVLPGPQGTLYGAESESGTIRIITNKPDTTAFSAGYTGQLNTIYNGTLGGIAEGFVNIPVTSNLAIRLVGWYERDSGYIDNVPQTIHYVTGGVINNSALVERHYNPTTVDGGRAELKFVINDNWSINPTVITQKTRWDGVFGQEQWKDLPGSAIAAETGSYGSAIPSNLSVAEFFPATGKEAFVDTALTVLGKIGNFDLTYAAAYLTRENYTYGQYLDYTIGYTQYDQYWPANNPSMTVSNRDSYQIYSNELRVASPTDYPLRIVAGLFQERQETTDEYFLKVPGLDPTYWVGDGTNFVLTDTWWLTNQQRVDRDWAAYAEGNWDITAHLTATVGFRRFRYDNDEHGFYGLGLDNPVGPPGQQSCFSTQRYDLGPCTDVRVGAEGWGSTPKFNLSYKFDPERMAYATFSRGFRPGGVNRSSVAPPFKPDFLTNYEIGWKTTWLDRHLIFNGAFYFEQWKNFQYSFVGPNGILLIANAGNAEVKGAEGHVQWLVTRGLSLSGDVTYNDSYLVDNYCGVLGPNGQPITSNPCMVPGKAPFAPKALAGQRSPFTPLWKTSLNARYSWPLGAATAFVEGDEVYQSSVWPAFLIKERNNLGIEPAYALTNLSVGYDKDNYEIELLIRNVFNRVGIEDRFAELTNVENIAVDNVVTPPRLIGLQFSQHF
jgi:iron complex outermembrane recepter protein